MANLDLSILVVDDAKFSSMVVSRTLTKAGYRDVRIANNARAALEMMESRPASLLIADWLMPEMDGLALTDKIRQIDEQRNHYTYVVLLTAKESVAALAEAFDRGVDDRGVGTKNLRVARIRRVMSMLLMVSLLANLAEGMGFEPMIPLRV